MTNQEAFDIVCNHLMTQERRSVRIITLNSGEKTGECLYRELAINQIEGSLGVAFEREED